MATSTSTTPSAVPAPAGKNSLRYAWYVVFVLMLCYTLSFVDRQILSLLVGPIKHDLGISDTKMGLLLGFAFAIFYTFAGLPIGRIVDTYGRRNPIAVGIFLWSIMTACAAPRAATGRCFSRASAWAWAKRRSRRLHFR